MRRLFMLALLCTAYTSGQAQNAKLIPITIETSLGTIEAELDSARAPITVTNFLRYIDSRAFDNGYFHRTVRMDNQPTDSVRIEVIQGSIVRGNPALRLPPIELERTNMTGLRHTDGALSMARSGPNTATSDFFITIGAQPELDFGGKRQRDGQGFAVFGRVTKGMEIVTRIQSQPAQRQSLTPPITITRIVRGPAQSTQDKRALWLDPSNAEWRKPAPPVSHLRVETTKGVFVLELIRAWAPIGVDRMYNLARLGRMDDTRFHRVNPNYIAQWGLHGDSAVNAAWRTAYIQDDPPRAKNVRGSFAFATNTATPNMRTTQIYVNLADNTRNDGEPFTMLGTVIEGMPVLDSLYSGYGENSGSGVRQGRQGPLANGGNAFMDREYPRLDRIIRVTVTEAKQQISR